MRRDRWSAAQSIVSRRGVLGGGLAAGLLLGRRATAHEPEPFVLPEAYQPARVPFAPGLFPGEIHVLPDEFHLYWTLGDGEAIRFAVGVGRPGLYEAGAFSVGARQEWPSWRPTDDMIERDPDAYAQYADGMPGGPDNPLGARALYLHNAGGQDTYLRIHGTTEPHTIGTAVSNGCARLTNDHVVELYDLVPVGTAVFLYEQTASGSDA